MGFINHILQGPEVLPLVVSHSPPEVSFLHLVYLNKLEIPELVLRTPAAIVTGAILPLTGFLISNMINTFLEPTDELHKDSKFWALMFISLVDKKDWVDVLQENCSHGSRLVWQSWDKKWDIQVAGEIYIKIKWASYYDKKWHIQFFFL